MISSYSVLYFYAFLIEFIKYTSSAKKAVNVIELRYLGKNSHVIPTYTKIGEFLINIFSGILFKQEIRSNQSSFRAFKRSILDLFKGLMFSKFALCLEMCYKAALHKVRIKEVPITSPPKKYGTSYVNLLKLFISISACILIYTLKKNFKIGGVKEIRKNLIKISF